MSKKNDNKKRKMIIELFNQGYSFEGIANKVNEAGIKCSVEGVMYELRRAGINIEFIMTLK